MVFLTRLRLRSALFLPQFFWLNESVIRQLRASQGFRGGKLLADKSLVFWMATQWADPSSMRSFRDSGAHRVALPRLVSWCDEAAVAESETWETIRSWADIHDWPSTRGRPSKLRHPSRAHPLLRFPPPAWTRLERYVKPARQ
jgi:hypothetical protein